MEFTNNFTKKMEQLERKNWLYDSELKKCVMEEIYELEDDINDDQSFLLSGMDDAKDDVEYWYCIHALAISLNIKG